MLLAVVDTSVFISGYTVIKRLVETMAALDDPVRAAEGGPFQLRIQVVVPFKVRFATTGVCVNVRAPYHHMPP